MGISKFSSLIILI